MRAFVLLAVVVVAAIAAESGAGGEADAPAACTIAIADARATFSQTGDAFGAVSRMLVAADGYPSLVYRAAVAGQNGDRAEINRIAAKMGSIQKVVKRATARITSDSKQIKALVSLFKS